MTLKTFVQVVTFTGLAALSSCSDGEQVKSITDRNSAYFFEDEGVYLPLGTTDFVGKSIATGDWDRDGDMDFLECYRDGTVYLHENNGGVLCKVTTPLFRLPTISAYGGCVFNVLDNDGDGDMDILAVDQQGKIHLYRNNQRSNFMHPPEDLLPKDRCPYQE